MCSSQAFGTSFSLPLFSNRWPTDFALIAHISAFAPQTNTICISIMAISLIILAAPANVTYVTGHLTIALRNFPCHPIKLSNGMSVHHIRYCYHHTSIWFYRRGERSFRGHRRNLFHEQLKLAGAARGLPGDRCPSRRSFFAYQYNCHFARQASGHEPGRSSRNRSHQNLRSETVKTRRYKKTYSHRKNRQAYRDWLSQRLRWMGSIPSGSVYKMQFSSLPKSAITINTFLNPYLSIESKLFLEHTFSLTDWTVLELDSTISQPHHDPAIT